MSLSWQRLRWARYPIPADLTGKRVLDIGAWDGWFSFEAERRGAAVTSVDCVEIPNYLHIHRKLGSKAVYRNLDLYELPDAGLGKFDIVFCLGVLYHVKHPLLALEIVCSLATDVAVVESFVTDGETWREHQGEIPLTINIVDLPQALIDNSPKGEVKLRVNQHFRVQPGSDLQAKLLQVYATAKYIF